VPYVITAACVDLKDRSCVRECPVDCIYEGERALYINPEECVDCGACESACPNDAVFYESEVPADQFAAIQDNADFFRLPLVNGAAIGDPGGAKRYGPIAADTPLVAALPSAKPKETP